MKRIDVWGYRRRRMSTHRGFNTRLVLSTGLPLRLLVSAHLFAPMSGSLILGLLLIASVGALAADSDYVVPLQCGSALGQASSTYEGLDEWIGLPYATPPVGHMRWQPAQPPQCTNERINATTLGPRCWGFDAPPNGLSRPESEDCLLLNVYVSHNNREKQAKDLPVIFWSHGGSNIFGSVRVFTPGSPLSLTL